MNDGINSGKMENEVVNNGFPDLESAVRGLEISPCHKCGEHGQLHSSMRRDHKYSVSIGCKCGTPYSVIYESPDTVVNLVRLWNRYQHIKNITKGMKR